MTDEFYKKYVRIANLLEDVIEEAMHIKYDRDMYMVFREAHSIQVFVRDLLDEEHERRMDSCEENGDEED